LRHAGKNAKSLIPRADAAPTRQRLPNSSDWLYEIKLDGYRALAFKRDGKVRLHSRNDNDFGARHPSVVAALSKLTDDTVIDGEIVALD
jgi:bifunctional non-homologous end joining protein LigD